MEGKILPEKRQIVVDYDTEDGSYRGSVIEISVDGIFIETEDSFTVGQEISLNFSLVNDLDHFMLIGKVTNRLPKGIEVKFKNLTQQERSLLSDLFFHSPGF